MAQGSLARARCCWLADRRWESGEEGGAQLEDGAREHGVVRGCCARLAECTLAIVPAVGTGGAGEGMSRGNAA